MSSFDWGPAQDGLEDLAEVLDETLSARFGERLRSIRCDWADERIVLGWVGTVPREAKVLVEMHRGGDQVVRFAAPDLRRDFTTRWRTIQEVTAELGSAGFGVVRAWKSEDRDFIEVALDPAPLDRRVQAARITASVQAGSGHRVRLHWQGSPADEIAAAIAAAPSVLSIIFDTSQPNYPTVRLLIDGEEELAHDGDDEPNTPAGLLQSGALIPTTPPRRVAFYGCGCGEFGCSNVAGVVSRHGDRIVWSDFRNLVGAYASALPLSGEPPDPYTTDSGEGSYDHSELPLTAYSFDRRQYLETVDAATADRSWENRPQAVVREINTLRPDLRGIWPTTTGERIEVSYRRPGQEKLDWAQLDIPPGPPQQVAVSLVLLLERGTPLEHIKRDDLWR